MNAKPCIVLFVLFAVILSSCQAATPAVLSPSATGQNVVVTQLVEKEVVVYPAQPQYNLPQVQPTRVLPAAGSVPPPADNYFEYYGVNPFTDAYEDHLSTFALDVDTASYSVARRYIQDGNLPPVEAVRVEEFINYFDPGYPTPQGVAFGIYADGARSPFPQDAAAGIYILRFGVQGYRIPEAERQPLTLTFVIDISGSMAMENRLELVKKSLNLLIDQLGPEDTVAVIVYGSDARVALQTTSGKERGVISRAVKSLKTEGATNAEAGLKLGYETAMRSYRPGTANRLILCSDGVANVGATKPDAILKQVRGYVKEGIRLTTVGFGMGNFNDVLMEQLADNGDGNYAYVDTLDEARKLFVENLTSTLQVIALDAKIQVDFNPDLVYRYRLIGYENRDIADHDFRNDQVDAGELGPGHSATALYAVQLKPDSNGRIATVQLRWQDPQTYQVQEINGNFNTWDLSSSFEATAPRFRLAVLAAQYAEILRRSPWSGQISLGQLSQMASGLVEELPDDPEVAEFVDLLYRANRIATW